MRWLVVLSIGVMGASALAAGPDLERAAREERARRARVVRHAPIYSSRSVRAWDLVIALATSTTPADRTRARTVAPEARAEAATPSPSPARVPVVPPGARPAASPVHDEAYWRKRMKEAAGRIAELASDLDWTQKKVLILRMDLVVPTDGAREFNRSAELQALLGKQADLEKQLAEAKEAPARIREEARKEDALPGWFR